MRIEKIGNLTLVCGDCMEYMAQTDTVFDLAVCDPDYGLNNRLRGGTWADRYGVEGMNLGGVPDASYFARLMNRSRNQIIWGGNYFAHLLPPTRCFLVWDKKDKIPKMADCEMAWTSFDKNAKVFSSARNPKGISGMDKRIHICQKPVQLYMWVYEGYSNPGDKILDTHMGSGSSAIAAYECGREYVGIEINPEYFEKSLERIKKHILTHPKL